MVSTSAKKASSRFTISAAARSIFPFCKLHDGIFEVLATNGDTHLGGDDIDNLLIRIALEDIATEWGEDVSGNQEARPASAPRRDPGQGRAFVCSVSAIIDLEYRRQDTISARLTRDAVRTADRADRRAHARPLPRLPRGREVAVEDIDEVVMVGGSTRIPLVRSAVETLFSAEPHTELNPDEVVALGAAVQAGILSGDVEDTAAAGCDAAVAGNRDHGRSRIEADSSQFDHSGQRDRAVHHRCGWTDAMC